MPSVRLWMASKWGILLWTKAEPSGLCRHNFYYWHLQVPVVPGTVMDFHRRELIQYRIATPTSGFQIE